MAQDTSRYLIGYRKRICGKPEPADDLGSAGWREADEQLATHRSDRSENAIIPQTEPHPMRYVTIALILTIAFVSGCSKQPELTPEQVRAAKFLEENFDPRIYEINDRLGKIEIAKEDAETWYFVTLELLNQFNVRKAQQGHEAAIVWYQAESKKTGKELIAAWGPK